MNLQDAAGLLYKPSAWGTEFHSLRTDEALGAGAAGPGKTQVLIMEPIFQAAVEHERCMNKSHPHRMTWGMSSGVYLHLRRTTPQLENTINRTHRIYPQIDPQIRWDAKKLTWTFRSGYKIQFGHCNERDDWENYMSAEFSGLAFDELTAFEEEQYDQICTRVRSSDPVLRHMLKIRSMSNPMMRHEGGQVITVRNPHWVRERFVEPAPEGRQILKRAVKRRDGRIEWLTRIYIPAKLWDNPDKEFVEGYERLQLGKPEHIRRALLEGDWFVTVGAFYADSWNPRLHVCKPFRIPPDWPQFRMMDWGFKNPGCVYWAALDPDDNMWVHKELTFKGRTATEVACDIRDIEEGLGLWKGKRSCITGPADTQLWEARGESGVSKAQEMANVGVHWVRADKRSRQRNAERLTERLNDHHNGTTTPGIMFFQSCKMAIKTIPSIQADANQPECPADGGDDHWHDALGYGCAYASKGAAGVSDTRNRDDVLDDDSQNVAPRGRNGYGAAY